MHFEILIEDLSGKNVINILLRKIIGTSHTYHIHPYKGIGRIPKNLKTTTNVSSRFLLDDLPKQLNAYGKTYSNDPTKVVIVICDLDNRCLSVFRQQLFKILNSCHPPPITRFCIAIEEGEAWLLGDIPAIKKAYPSANDNVLNSYLNDSICGTWELLADAIFPGGSSSPKLKYWYQRGMIKSQWAGKIAPYMDVENNNSPSFCYFRDKIRELI